MLRISFCFTENAGSKRGYNGDNEASSSDSSDNENQGNARDMLDWLLLVYYLTSLMCRGLSLVGPFDFDSISRLRTLLKHLPRGCWRSVLSKKSVALLLNVSLLKGHLVSGHFYNSKNQKLDQYFLIT